MNRCGLSTHGGMGRYEQGTGMHGASGIVAFRYPASLPSLSPDLKESVPVSKSNSNKS